MNALSAVLNVEVSLYSSVRLPSRRSPYTGEGEVRVWMERENDQFCKCLLRIFPILRPLGEGL
jgi:hypothetical protein